MNIIAITGTNGKTTTSFMLEHMLRSLGYGTGLLGTVIYKVGKRVIPADRTTPESTDVFH